MLGGPRAFAEGGYAGTPVADVAAGRARPRGARGANGEVPVAHLAGAADARRRVARRDADRRHRSGVGGALARAAAAHQRQPDHAPSSRARRCCSAAPTTAAASRSCWRRSATAAARRSRRRSRTRGCGRCTRVMSLEDQTHENYWRQMLRWLVDDVPDTVDAHTVTDRVEPGETVTLVADVVDRAFVELNDAKVAAYVTGPSAASRGGAGAVDRRARTASTAPASRRRAEGVYTVAGRGARAPARRSAARVTQVRAVPSDAEYFDATMQAARLRADRRRDRRTLLYAANLAGLPEDVQYTGRGVTTVEERELWHMPIVLHADCSALMVAASGAAADGKAGLRVTRTDCLRLTLCVACCARAAARAAPAAAQDAHVAVIVGLGGEPEHAETFRRWAASLVDHAGGRLGIPPRAHPLSARGSAAGSEARDREGHQGGDRKAARRARRRGRRPTTSCSSC